ncbi:MAG: energy-coupling factor ABC transporter ATP-binding protein [Desulfarculaceae bacterium]|nr:energy-coupling factor ABC transporter ATP-binding protein [Desulfarculaceae bacterium]MCF8046969.1 energy-coupling factor ABC transporter ATP-binding protein [Desulfarculaceae bacterium]MCF8066502.1 energy-coupling factor ABC transporter ATP-binding protein [Desulfarculaceae bacterium]MCF8098087.1 energy-coupling factor ABC transporter ATP-binding protein [Desulfarculaceae bacterium]MCF8123136.1 energy-coupling factor ABC transporter ATP-binding protein [Desulfarculaceae bacterium]
MELIRLEGVSFAYAGRPPVFQGMDFSLSQGQRLGILGPNGAGKSTLFQICLGLLHPQQGKVYARGSLCQGEKDFRALRRELGYLFQDPDDQLFCLTVAEDVAFGPLNLGKGHREVQRLVTDTLDSLGLGDYGRRLTYQLSGGEKRLISLATVLAMQPKALLLDEPSTGLDSERAAAMEKVLDESNLSWAMVSHDQSLLERTCHNIVRLEGGLLKDLP